MGRGSAGMSSRRSVGPVPLFPVEAPCENASKGLVHLGARRLGHGNFEALRGGGRRLSERFLASRDGRQAAAVSAIPVACLVGASSLRARAGLGRAGLADVPVRAQIDLADRRGKARHHQKPDQYRAQSAHSVHYTPGRKRESSRHVLIGYLAPSPRSPVRITMLSSIGMMKMRPSPALPVWAA